MRLLLDENMSDRRLAERLRALGHDPVLATDVGLLSATDSRVFIGAIAQALPVLTRDSKDFTDLYGIKRIALEFSEESLIFSKTGEWIRGEATDRAPFSCAIFLRAWHGGKLPLFTLVGITDLLHDHVLLNGGELSPPNDAGTCQFACTVDRSSRRQTRKSYAIVAPRLLSVISPLPPG